MIYILQLIFSLCSCDDAQADQHQGGHGGGLLDGHRAVAKNIGIIWDISGYFEWAPSYSQEYGIFWDILNGHGTVANNIVVPK